MAQKNNACRSAQATNLAGLFNRLDIRTSGGGSTLATFTLSWGSATNGVISVSGTPLSVTASGTGTAAEARLYHATNTEEISGITVTATGGGGQITLDNTSITSGQTVNLSSFTLTEPSATA